MALFASRYLASKPFDLKAFGDIQTYALSGYYNIHDYAVTSWCHHTEVAIARSSSLSADLFSEVIHSLSAHLRFHLEVQAGEFPDHPTPDDILPRFRQLSTNGRARQEFGNLRARTLAIREVIEAIWALMPHNPDMQKSIGLQMYGPKQFKCCNTWCNWFSDGFQGAEQRRDHIDQHNRPFRCPVDGCFAGALGFPSEQQLQQHATRHHREAEKLLFPTTLFVKKHPNIAAAIRAGDLEAVKSTIQKSIAVTGAFDFAHSIKLLGPSKARTILTLAVDLKHFDICQYLLEEGASPDSQDFQAAIAQNDADILGLLVSHIPSAKIANLDPGSFYAADNETQRMVMKTVEFHHPCSIFLDSFVLNAIKQDRHEIVKSFLDCEGGIIRQGLKADYHTLMEHILGSSQECLQVLLSIDRSGVLLKQVFFEAHARGDEYILSRLPPLVPRLSDWICLQEYHNSHAKDGRHRERWKSLTQVVSKFAGTNIWASLGVSFRFLPLDARLIEMDQSTLREMLTTDDSLFHQKDERGATLLHGFIASGNIEMVQFATMVPGVDLDVPCKGLDDGDSLSPIKLALQRIGDLSRGMWDTSTKILWSLLSTGRMDLSEIEIDDELVCLITIGKQKIPSFQSIIEEALSHLCPTATRDEIKSLIQRLPFLADDLATIRRLGLHVGVRKREFGLSRLMKDKDLYSLFGTLIAERDFAAATKLFSKKNERYLLTEAERAAFIDFAIKDNDPYTLIKLLIDEDVTRTAAFSIAAHGPSALLEALLATRGVDFGRVNDDGLTLLQVAQDHQNENVAEWLQKHGKC